MATLDQLEIVHPDGSVGFYDLEPNKGTTNIGSDPENDIVIDSPEVPLFLAMIDHRVKPYQIMILDQEGNIELDGQLLQPNLGYDLYGWSTVAINGHSLVLTEHGALSAAPAEARPAASPGATEGKPVAAALPAAAAAAGTVHRLTLPPADHLDDYLRGELLERENTIECEQTASYPLTMINGGDIVATFEVTIEGLDPAWVVIEPPSVNLNEGERASITIAITPPRVPASRAGTHHFAVIITSPNHPDRSTRLGATLNLNPFYDFAISDLSPRQLNTGWRKQARTAVTALALVNKSNAESVFRVDGEDDQRACAFEYQQPETGAGRSARQTEVRLQPEATAALSVYVTPMKRRLVGLRKQSYSLTVTSLPLSGQQTPRSVMGQLQASPLIGPWAILGIAGLLALLIVWIFHPYINYFELTSPNEILGGQSASLEWGTSPFVQLKLLEEKTTADKAKTVQEVGAVTAPNGASTFTLYETVRYRLVASNLLSNLLPFLATQSEWLEVTVQPVPPVIDKFNPLPVERLTIVLGESVNLFYRVLNADKVTLLGSDGLVQSVVPTDTGSLIVAPTMKTTYNMGAVNRYGTAVPKQVIIAVVTPTPTPVPKPNVLQFSVEPRTITEGQSVKITWDVTGAENIKIEGLTGSDKLSARGNLEQQPAPPGIDYTLIATNGPEGAKAEEVVGPYHVKVIKAPPPPVAPQIVVFQAFPAEGIVLGDNAELQWSVTGTTTDIFLTGEGLPADGLRVSASGKQNVYPKATGIYLLTALNGTASVVKDVTIKVSEPVAPPIIVDFAASPDVVDQTGRVMLSWTVSGEFADISLSSSDIPFDSMNGLAPVGSQRVVPENSGTYLLTVSYRDSDQTTQYVRRNVSVSVNQLPLPIITYFRASCLDGSMTSCGLYPVQPAQPVTNTVTYKIWAGRSGSLYWLTQNATPQITLTLSVNYVRQSDEPYPNDDGTESPTPRYQTPGLTQARVDYLLTARNSVGARTSYRLIFEPYREPPPPPYDVSGQTIGVVGGPTLGVTVTWKYPYQNLGDITDFLVKRYPPGSSVAETQRVPYATACQEFPAGSGVAVCSFRDNLTAPGTSTCGQEYTVVALYQDIGRESETDSGNSWSIGPCPSQQ